MSASDYKAGWLAEVANICRAITDLYSERERLILRIFDSGVSPKAIAAAFDVTPGRIEQVIKRHRGTVKGAA